MFQKQIRNWNTCFALATFNVSVDWTKNSRNVFSFKIAGQVYQKINSAAHPLQTPEGHFEPYSYEQMYFLDSNGDAKEHLSPFKLLDQS